MRTADRLVDEQWAFPLDLDDTRPFLDWAASVVRATTTPVVVADNVADYLDARQAAVTLDGYPSLAPPWEECWIEYHSLKRRIGVLVGDATEMARGPSPGEFNPENYDFHLSELSARARLNAEAEGGEPRWVVVFILFFEHDKRVWGPAGCLALALDEAGQVIGNNWSVAPFTAVAQAIEAVRAREIEDPNDVPIPTLDDLKRLGREHIPEVQEHMKSLLHRLDGIVETHTEKLEALSEARDFVDSTKPFSESGDLLGVGNDWLMYALAPALQTVAFLHCKNVELAENTATEKVQRRRRQRGRAELVSYHTLRLEVPRRASTGGGKGHHEAASFHIVAGHFSHYGDCCPTIHEPHGLLFGRLTGVYWHPSHVRGDREHGEVYTDFEIAPVAS